MIKNYKHIKHAEDSVVMCREDEIIAAMNEAATTVPSGMSKELWTKQAAIDACLVPLTQEEEHELCELHASWWAEEIRQDMYFTL